MTIQPDDPTSPEVVALLDAHLTFARAQSPPEDVHAMDAQRLADERVTFFSARVDDVLVGVGALRHLDPSHAEIKSMHTTLPARGRGVGRAMVGHLLDVARERGYTRVSLETGTMEAFQPARSLYESFGFEVCEPFGDYFHSPHSICMTLELAG